MTPTPFMDCDCMCSMSMTELVRARLRSVTMSVGIRSSVTILSTAMSSAITMNVYRRRNVCLTIHVMGCLSLSVLLPDRVNCRSVHEPHGTADVRMREMHSLHWEMP